MSCRYLLLLFILSNVCLCSRLLVQDDAHADDNVNESRRESYMKSIRQREVHKNIILARLFLRIKKPNQPLFNLTEIEMKAIGKRTSHCLGKKSNKRTTMSRNKHTYERDRCIIVPPLCPNDLSTALKDQNLPDVSFLFEVNSLYKKNTDTESLKVISINLNLKLHKKGAEIANKSNISLKIYGVTNRPSANTYLLRKIKVVSGRNRWLKIQLGKEFSEFRRQARLDGGLKPFGITLLLENNENEGYIQPEELFHEHRCLKTKKGSKSNSSFSMPHLMVAQMARVRNRYTLKNVIIAKGSRSLT